MDSPAKLNLGLRLIGRRPDGYHLIQSLFWPLDFSDRMTLSQAKALSVQAAWANDALKHQSGLPQERDNLVFRTAEKTRSALFIHLEKRIPMGAGLGGGSSNCGTLLHYLWKQGELTQSHAEKVALEVGADVPFFLTRQPAWVEGIGEKRTPIRIASSLEKELTFLLVIPPSDIPTPVIFSKYRALGVPLATPIKLPKVKEWTWATLKKYLAGAENSLQAIAALEYPLVRDILSALSKTRAQHVALTGTGSTCFAVFQNPDQARESAKDLQPFCRKTGCQSLLAKTFSEPG